MKSFIHDFGRKTDLTIQGSYLTEKQKINSTSAYNLAFNYNCYSQQDVEQAYEQIKQEIDQLESITKKGKLEILMRGKLLDAPVANKFENFHDFHDFLSQKQVIDPIMDCKIVFEKSR